MNAERAMTYTPAANYHGADSFTYTTVTGNGGRRSATVSVTVSAVNDAPIGRRPVRDRAIPDADPDRAARLRRRRRRADVPCRRPAAARCALGHRRQPGLHARGRASRDADAFTFVANDGAADSSAATVTPPGARPVSRPPEAEDQWMLLDEDTSVEITLERRRSGRRPADLHDRVAADARHAVGQRHQPDLHAGSRLLGRRPVHVPRERRHERQQRRERRPLDLVGQRSTRRGGRRRSPGRPGESINGQFQATDREEDWVFFWITSEPSNGTVTLDPMTGLFTYEPSPGQFRATTASATPSTTGSRRAPSRPSTSCPLTSPGQSHRRRRRRPRTTKSVIADIFRQRLRTRTPPYFPPVRPRSDRRSTFG